MHKVISQHEPGNVICHNSWQNKAIIWVLPFHIPILYNTLSNYFTYIVILFLPFFVSHNITNFIHNTIYFLQNALLHGNIYCFPFSLLLSLIYLLLLLLFLYLFIFLLYQGISWYNTQMNKVNKMLLWIE